MISCTIGRKRWCDVIFLVVHALTGDKIMGLIIRQMEIHITEQFAPELSPSDVEVGTEMLKRYK
jgi:hypothetical protein